MSRFHSYLNSAAGILSSYKGEEPLSSFLKKIFSENKKYGSKDRKQISHLCYCCLRLGKAGNGIPPEERIVTGLFICSDSPGELLQHLKPEWNEKTSLSLKDKLSETGINLSTVFPWKEELSGGIDHENFSLSFFIQPDLFLRIRPGYKEKILEKIAGHSIPHEFIPPFTLRLSNSFKADEYIDLDKEAVVQDYNSQKTGEFLPASPGKLWDSCAASGGKSIMAHDLHPSLDITVSDVRETVLVNLKKRFEKAGIPKYRSFLADLVGSVPSIPHSPFDLIIADVPCSGSGTWSRTPEQLVFFDEKKISEYAGRQKKITSCLIPHLQAGGHLLYITCSVFKKENEDIVRFLEEKFHLRVKKMELLKGYEIKADSMFAALLEKPL